MLCASGEGGVLYGSVLWINRACIHEFPSAYHLPNHNSLSLQHAASSREVYHTALDSSRGRQAAVMLSRADMCLRTRHHYHQSWVCGILCMGCCQLVLGCCAC